MASFRSADRHVGRTAKIAAEQGHAVTIFGYDSDMFFLHRLGDGVWLATLPCGPGLVSSKTFPIGNVVRGTCINQDQMVRLPCICSTCFTCSRIARESV